jgi:cellulose synthase/poly-beta-1,6-N-acetylglucosamine synthase-like glycosyltransferase
VGGWLPEAWGVYVPLGLIGLWRWAVWALKRGLALLYRPRRPLAAPPPVSLVVPVFREGPAAFEAALRSWIAERPAEIVVVIDHGDAGCIEVFRRLAAAGGPVTLELIVTAEPGKRPALARGIRQARHEIVALVDSDTIWEHGVIAAATAPFADHVSRAWGRGRTCTSRARCGSAWPTSCSTSASRTRCRSSHAWAPTSRACPGARPSTGGRCCCRCCHS